MFPLSIIRTRVGVKVPDEDSPPGRGGRVLNETL